jgi:hypothetical protein
MLDTNGKTVKSFRVMDILVGLMALLIGILYLAPVKFLGFSICLEMAVFSYVVFSVVLIVVAASRLVGTFSLEISKMAKQIAVTTSILVVISMIFILFFEIVSAEQSWFHYLFGLGLLSYAIGRIAIGFFARQYNFGWRAITLGFGIAISILSIVVLWFRLIPLSSNNNTSYGVFLSSGFLIIPSLIIIGIDFLISSLILLKWQKQSP